MFLHLQEYLVISSDAWSPTQGGAHVLNVNALANGTSMCLGILYTGMESHTGTYIAGEIEKVLLEYGVDDKVCFEPTNNTSPHTSALFTMCATFVKQCSYLAAISCRWSAL